MKKRNLKLKYGALTLGSCLFFACILFLVSMVLRYLFLSEVTSGKFSLYGDLNRDGVVDYQDGDFMAKLLLEGDEANQKVQMIDFNRDSVIDNADTLYYYAYYDSQYYDRILFEDFVNMVNRKEVVFYE